MCEDVRTRTNLSIQINICWPKRTRSAPPRADTRAPAERHLHPLHRQGSPQRRWMSPSAAPATQSEGGCRQVPRLPCKVPRRPGRPTASKRATRASPVPYVPHLSRKTKVDGPERHACHAKRRSRLPRKVKVDVAKWRLPRKVPRRPRLHCGPRV